MTFLVPAALGLAALAGPLIVLYMLRSKRRPQEVSSTMLWGEVGEPVSAAVPWKPLRLTALLLLQLAVLALFVLSLARPFVAEATVLGPHTVFVMDTSGSMAMASRFEQAQARAVDLAADVSQANLASVVEAGPQPRVLVAFSADAEAVISAVENLEVGGGSEDLSGAIRLARGLASPDRDTSVVIFSDGGANPIPEEPVLGATHLRFDDIASNVAITAFDAEPSAEGAVRVFIQVENTGADDRSVAVELAVDGLPAGSVDMEVDGLATAQEVVPLDASAGSVLTATLNNSDDALALDNRADLVIGGGSTTTVAIEGAGSPFLDALLSSISGVTAAEDGEVADVTIVDGGDLGDVDGPAWIMRTSTPPEGLELTGLERNLAVTFQRPGDPVLDGVDLSEVAVAEAQATEGIAWLPVVSSGDIPLLLLGEVNGYRVVYQTFDIVHSNLGVQVAFPILGANLLRWLDGGDIGAVSTQPAGTPIQLVTPPGHTPRVTDPSGRQFDLASDAGTFNATDQPGIYTVGYVSADGSVSEGEVAVRRFVASESSVRPRDIAVAAGPQGTDDEARLIREWAPWVLALALLLMGIEWWVGHQRPLPWVRASERSPHEV